MTYSKINETIQSTESFHKSWNEAIDQLIIDNDLNKESFKISTILENQVYAPVKKDYHIVGKYIQYLISKDERVIGFICGFLANNKSYSEIYSYPN